MAKPGGAGIKGIETENGYLITGTAPWVCGHEIFDYLLVGFETNDAIHFAMIDFPVANPDVEPSTQEMICLNGTATVNLKFKNLLIKNSEWIQSRKKPIAPQPRKTTFLIPELGIGKTALLETKRLIKDSNHPRHILVAKNISGLEARLGSIKTLKKDGESLDALVLLRDDFNRDAIRMLAIATGASALNKNSLAARLQMETFLLDSVIHSPTALAAKISKLGQSNT